MFSNISEGDKVKIGIRPEHLEINQISDVVWEGKVFVVEKLGSGTFLYIDKDGEPLVVQTEGDTNIKVGDKVKVGISLPYNEKVPQSFNIFFLILVSGKFN